ncbi:hypothetical protein EHW64_18845 [Erwinia psidii]|uniref:hypothetical protein n=1 Tax=Erwinia psidii TaxID=69224 RepID=UPI00226B1E4A|nr:hypothetical protein [Erwinia psidii]MCX8963116.1 hypothetical protein [Erwinia psidii]
MSGEHRRETTVNIKIESAQEKIVSADPEGDAVLAMEDALSLVMRKPAKKMLIRAYKGSCPAFEYWADRLNSGERLPRGKYFKACDYLRYFQ